MASTSPTMALIGDVNGKLGQELKAHINLTAYNGSLQGLDGVVLDGQSAPAAALTDTQTLSMIRQSGKMVAAPNSTEQLLTTLLALTGAGPWGPGGAHYLHQGPGRARCCPCPLSLGRGAVRKGLTAAHFSRNQCRSASGGFARDSTVGVGHCRGPKR